MPAYSKVLRLATFNLYGKNISFLMNASGERKLAAAYDLAFLNLSHNLHSTMSACESRSPGEQQLFELANTIAVKDPITIIDQAKSVLADWNSYAKDSGVGDDSK